MSAAILHHPMFERLQEQMQRVFSEQPDELRQARGLLVALGQVLAEPGAQQAQVLARGAAIALRIATGK